MVNKTDTLVACIAELAPTAMSIGADPFDVERLAWNIQRAEYSRPGEVTQSALAAFDVACWDLDRSVAGRADLEAARRADSATACRRTPTAGTRPSATRPRSRRWRATSSRAAIARSSSIRSAAPALKLPPAERRRVGRASSPRCARRSGPTCRSWSRCTAASRAAAAATSRPSSSRSIPDWIEEPVPPENPTALARVRSATRLPIATGERAHTLADIRGFIEQGLVDIVQVDLTHFGGFTADEDAGRLGRGATSCCWRRTTSAARWGRWRTCTSRSRRRTTRSSSTSTTSPTAGCSELVDAAPRDRSARRLLPGARPHPASACASITTPAPSIRARTRGSSSSAKGGSGEANRRRRRRREQ